MRVIHDKHDRACLGRLAHELEGSESDSVGIRLDLLAGAKRRAQRPPLRSWKPGGLPEDGVQQLVQPGERELGLLLHSHGGQSPTARSLGSLPGEAQERGFADPGLASEDQRSAAYLEAVHHRRDEFGLRLAPDQVANRVGPDEAGQSIEDRRLLGRASAWLPERADDPLGQPAWGRWSPLGVAERARSRAGTEPASADLEPLPPHRRSARDCPPRGREHRVPVPSG